MKINLAVCLLGMMHVTGSRLRQVTESPVATADESDASVTELPKNVDTSLQEIDSEEPSEVTRERQAERDEQQMIEMQRMDKEAVEEFERGLNMPGPPDEFDESTDAGNTSDDSSSIELPPKINEVPDPIEKDTIVIPIVPDTIVKDPIVPDTIVKHEVPEEEKEFPYDMDDELIYKEKWSLNTIMSGKSREMDDANEDKIQPAYWEDINIAPVSDVISRVQNAGWNLGVLSRASVGRGYPNQDSYLVKIIEREGGLIGTPSGDQEPAFMVIAVFDGHGPEGDFVSLAVKDSFNDLLRSKFVDYQRLPPPSTSRWTEHLYRPEDRPPVDDEDDYVEEGRRHTSREIAIRDQIEEIFEEIQGQLREELINKGRELTEEDIILQSDGQGPKKFVDRFTASGCTASIILADFDDRLLYAINLGDSPIYVKFSKSDQLAKVSDDHNVANRAERERVDAAAKAFGYAVNRTQEANIFGGGAVSRKYFASNFTNEDGNVLETLPFYVHSVVNRRAIDDALMTDFRLDRLQLSRSLGHVNPLAGKMITMEDFILHQPRIAVWDLEVNPVDYVIVASDGLSQPFELAASAKAELQSEEAVGKNIVDVFNEWMDSENPYSEEFDDSHEQYAQFIDVSVVHRIQKIAESKVSNATECVEELFKESRKEYKKYMSGGYDDITAVVAQLTKMSVPPSGMPSSTIHVDVAPHTH